MMRLRVWEGVCVKSVIEFGGGGDDDDAFCFDISFCDIGRKGRKRKLKV